MPVNLSFPAPSAPYDRPVVPACLQRRAPSSYEIRDERDGLVEPTLAGYRLRRGKTYRLVVRTQEGSATGWTVRLVAPRSVAEPLGPDEVEGTARSIRFHTPSMAATELWHVFQSVVTNLPVHLDFGDGREPYRFSIPVVLLAGRLRRIGSALVCSLLSLAANALFHEGVNVPRPQHVALYGGAGLVLLAVCFLWDQFTFYRTALRLLPKRVHPGPVGN